MNAFERLTDTPMEDIQKAIESVSSKRAFMDEMNIASCGLNHKLVSRFLARHKLTIKRGRFEYIDVECPVCQKTFQTTSNPKRKQTTCSYACSNTYFRTGPGHGNWSGNNYRKICFNFHEKKCIICGETNIVAVHHMDEDNTNNDPKNLIPLCPTHHQYVHSGHKEKVLPQINEYIRSVG